MDRRYYSDIPSIRYTPNRDWSKLGNKLVHLTAETVKQAAPAILDLLPNIKHTWRLHIETAHGAFWADYKPLQYGDTDQDLIAACRALKKPQAHQIEITPMPRWMWS